MVRISGKIRSILVDAGLVTQEDWNSARDSGKPPVDVLLERGTITEERLFEVLGLTSGLPPIDLTRVKPDPQAIEALPQEMCTENCVLPIARNGDNLTVVISDPFDVMLLDDLNLKARCRVRPVLSYPAAIRRAQEQVFNRDQQQVDQLLEGVTSKDLEVEAEGSVEDLETATAVGKEDVPAVKLVNLIILRALRDKASDIHVEPMNSAVRVRYRIDGCLVEAMNPPKTMLPALLSRLKIMANLDIAIRFEPQDGKFQIRYENRNIDFRLSTLPVVGGEKAVMRILDGGSTAGRLDTMGFEPKCLQDFRNAINAPHGMVLVTGPTGSGKSTTLYAAMGEVASIDVNVVTVEDPVEYRMNGINQVPVAPKRGLTFAGALRSILRQDPDVILVGEIRDKETAEIAVKAALTGHLVLSTLHTNDAVQAVTRLVDMGIDPYLVSSSVILVAAQRLVRKLCEHCRVKVEVPRKELLANSVLETELADLQLYGPNVAGCPRCKNGYRGRMALLETLPLSLDLKRMVVEGRSVAEMKDKGLNEGMLTLRRIGVLNAMRGKTSLEEVLRITMGD
jgi:type IV pilus assembly protein PilB